MAEVPESIAFANLGASLTKEREAVRMATAINAAWTDPEFGLTEETHKVLSCVAGHWRRLHADDSDAVERFNETLNLRVKEGSSGLRLRDDD